ncbi:MAG TPA: DUF1349 domain-containing protein [Saprospiraceae bacterium]|nr:DUF1349 domain-containing protein [Saprospiraceae bacterium]
MNLIIADQSDNRHFIMEKSLTILLTSLLIWSCNTRQSDTSADSSETSISVPPTNFTNDYLERLNWLSQPRSATVKEGILAVTVDKSTDFFNNPEDGAISTTAPLLYEKIEGDFVVKALVRPDFEEVWNAVSLMVYMDSLHWIKFAFENSDATGPSVVTVVTKGVSDDANGAIMSGQKEVWLKLIRKNNNYSMLWSLDDKEYKMARLTSMPAADAVKVGIEAQCPVGESATHEILYYHSERKTVQDLRKGE